METLKDELRTMVQWQLLEEFQAWACEDRAYDAEAVGRIEFEIPVMDPLAWIRRQPHPIKMFGRDRESRYEIAGAGAVDILTNCQESSFDEIFSDLRARLNQADARIKYFGGIAFDPGAEIEDAWKPFGQYYFLLPRFELFTKDKRTYFACNFHAPEIQEQDTLLTTLLEELEAVDFSAAEIQFNPPACLGRSDFPSRATWQERVSTVLRDLTVAAGKPEQEEACGIEKLVLSRRAVFSLDQAVDAFGLLAVLRRMSVESFDFCFQPRQGHAFLGSTPELLYRRAGSQIASEAIAGTRKRGVTEEEDVFLERDLISSEKEEREHRLVLESIRKTLGELCQVVSVRKELSVLKLRLVQHLYSQLAGELKVSIRDEEILRALHPTPGVLGYPKLQAHEALRAHEPQTRGWYAGPMGWVGREEATFVVGIRSGLVVDKSLTLFSGAGIVSGSEPEREWEEIENKIRHFLAALQWDKTKGAFSEEGIG